MKDNNRKSPNHDYFAQQLHHANARVDNAKRVRIRTIVEAKQAGLSIRQISSECGLSPSRVHQLLTSNEAENTALAVSKKIRASTSHLRKATLFADVDDEALTSLAEYASAKVFPKNSILINESDYSDSMYVILSGSVEIFTSDANGKKVILNTLHAGDCVGELSLLDNRPRSASAKSTTACKVLTLSRASYCWVY